MLKTHPGPANIFSIFKLIGKANILSGITAFLNKYQFSQNFVRIFEFLGVSSFYLFILDIFINVTKEVAKTYKKSRTNYNLTF